MTEERSTGIAYGRRYRGLHNGRSVSQAIDDPGEIDEEGTLPKGPICHRSTKSPTRAAAAEQIEKASRRAQEWNALKGRELLSERELNTTF